MSVNFYSCDKCGESRYEEYVGHCSECGHSLCTNCVINDDIESNYAHDYGVRFDGSKEQKDYYGIYSKDEDEYGYEIGDIIDDAGIDSKYCPFCSGGVVHDDQLLYYSLKLLGKTKDELIEQHRKDNQITGSITKQE